MRIAMVLLAAVSCFGQSTAAVIWRELPPVLVDQKVSIPLPDGKRVQGEVLSVRDEGILMDVQKSSSRRFARGQALVPRDSVSTVKIIRDRGPFKLVGGIAGTAGGLLLVGVIGYTSGGVLAIPALFTVWPAAGMGGYYAGKAADRRVRTIRVVAEADIHD